MIKIEDKDYTKFAILPIKIMRSLDDGLGQGILTLKNLDRDLPFESLTKIDIDGEIWLVSVDKSIQSRFGKNPKFTHTITLIEETKLLEKYFVDTCTFTNKLLELPEEHNVMWKSHNVSEDESIDIPKNSNFYTNPTYLSPDKNSVHIYSSMEVLESSGYNAEYMVEVYKDYSSTRPELIWRTKDRNESYSLVNPKYGYYTVVYYTRKNSYYFTYSFWIVDAYQKDISITDVINRCLTISETLVEGEYPRFALNPIQKEQYSNILSPEFAITKSTLREALQQVGYYIHAKPILKNNNIIFKDLNNNRYANITRKPIDYNAQQDIEQFCSEIDCNVDNLVNIDDEQNGTIIEPFNSGYKTTRTELGTVNLTESNCFIETTMPIEKIVSVSIHTINGKDNNFLFYTITPYIYEKSLYSTLDSYNGTYPYSKAYALYYTQGQKNIYGLNFKEEDAVSQAFKKYAIINIFENVTGKEVKLEDNPLTKLQFRVTYIPIVSARIKQHKSNLNSTKQKSIIAYNATANKVDTDYYGENLKGAVERLGNIEKYLTYIITDKNTIPEPGLKFDKEYTIVNVYEEIYPNYYKITLGLSKHYNNWNKYVGVNNNQRFYEVSEKQSYERYVLREDFLVISNNNFVIETEDYNRSFIKKAFLDGIVNQMKGGPITYGISAMALTGFDKNGNSLNGVILPAISFALGNSVFFQVSYNNNFGAGSYVQNYIETNHGIKGFQSEVEYGDYLGCIKYLDVKGFRQPFKSGIFDYDPAQLPLLYNKPIEIPPDFETNKKIILEKDSREVINFAYQIHCTTDIDNLIVGSGLSKKLGAHYSKGNEEYVDIYIMQREIGKFEKEILDLPSEEMRIEYSIEINAENKQLNFSEINCNADGKSIVLVDRKSKELIYAINTEVSNGQIYQLPNMMFRHKIYDI